MKKTIKIDGMMCEHCISAVKKALKKYDEKVVVELNKALLNTSEKDEVLIEAIEDLGFEVKEIIHARS